MNEGHDVVVVGNGVAGYACAERLARHGRPPLLIGPGEIIDRPPLTKSALISGQPRRLASAEKLASLGIEHIDGVAQNVDAAGLTVNVTSAARGAEQIAARVLVLAMGLHYGTLPIPGLEHVHVNATPQGLAALAPRLASGSRRVLIVGAGLIGVETAATLAAAGHAITLVDLEERPLHRLHDPLPALAATELAASGVRFVGGVRLVSAKSVDSGTTVVDAGAHGELEADVVIAATGGRSAPLSGFPGAWPIPVDAQMRVAGFAGVHAIGDCAIPVHPRFGALRHPHWDTAVGGGECAADAITGDGTGTAYDRLPFWWSEIGTLRIAEVGHADASVGWQEEDGLYVGRDQAGAVACVLVVNAPRRVREARALVAELARRAA